MGLGLGFFLRTKTKIWEYIYIPVIIKNKYEETFLGKLASICIFLRQFLGERLHNCHKKLFMNIQWKNWDYEKPQSMKNIGLCFEKQQKASVIFYKGKNNIIECVFQN